MDLVVERDCVCGRVHDHVGSSTRRAQKHLVGVDEAEQERRARLRAPDLLALDVHAERRRLRVHTAERANQHPHHEDDAQRTDCRKKRGRVESELLHLLAGDDRTPRHGASLQSAPGALFGTISANTPVRSGRWRRPTRRKPRL